jgi:hypothetical protein
LVPEPTSYESPPPVQSVSEPLQNQSGGSKKYTRRHHSKHLCKSCKRMYHR